MQPKTISYTLLLFCLIFVGVAKGQFSASSTIPGTINTSSSGAGATNWSNTANIQALDNVFATCLITQANKPTYNLDAKNWGFQNTDTTKSNYVPSGATINGIEVTVNMRKTGTGTLKDNKIMLLNAGTETGLNKSRGSTTWPSTRTSIVFGGSTDLWGATLTGTDLLNTGFGVRLVAKSQGGRDVQAEIDNISIKVYFNLTYFYSKSAGDLSSITTWGRNSDGTGANPVNFTKDGQIFFLRNQTSPTLSNSLLISGIASKLVAGDSTNALTFTIPSAYSYSGPLDVSPLATVVVTNALAPSFGTISDNTTVTYNGTSQTIYGDSYYNLTVSGTGTKSLVSGAGTSSVTNVFTVGVGSVFNNNGIAITVSGTAGIVNNGTITGSGMLTYSLLDVSTSISGTGTYSNLEIQAVSTSNTTQTVTLSNAVTITDTLVLTEGSLVNGTNLTMASGSNIEVSDGSLAASISGSTGYSVIYSAFNIGTTKTTSNELTGTLRNFTLQAGSAITVSLNRNLMLTGNFTLTSGTLDPTTSNYNITIGGNYTNNATLTSRNITFTFNGSAAQTINAPSTQTFYKLTINSTGGVTLNTPVQVSNTFTLTNGLITSSSTNSITINSTATISGGSSSSYVNGPLVITLATTTQTSKLFPVGKSGAYRPATLSITQANTNATNYTAELFTGAPPSRTLPSGLYSVSSVRYWTISCSNAANVSSVFVRLEYGNDDNVTDPTTIKIVKSSGSNWINLGGLGSASGSGFINSTSSFNTFSDFVIASSTAPSVLPLKWITFTGRARDNNVQLNWKTASETNIDFYEVQRSTEPNQWKTIGKLTGKNAGSNEYEFMDADPFTTNFYRIREVDFNGKESYSAIIEVSSQVTTTFTVQPNPVTNHQFSCKVDEPSFITASQLQVSVIDMLGRMMMTFNTSGRSLIPVDAAKLPSGKYYVIISSGNKKIQTSVIIR
jgi:trimeric autotransporter adhesin